MKLVESKLFLEFNDLPDAGIKPVTVKMAKLRGSKGWQFIDDPADSRKVLIEYEPLPIRYKANVEAYFGNPYDYLAKKPIKDLLVPDYKAEEFFTAYRFDEDKMLPMDAVRAYVKAATWLNLLVRLEADHRFIKETLKLSVGAFYNHACDIIRAEKVDLPTCYRRIKDRMAEYQREGYSCLINARYGNRNASKVTDEVSASMLLELIANQNQHDDTIIARAYNQWAQAAGYKPITAGTVGIHRKKNDYLVSQYRQGRAAAYNVYGKQIMRKRPSAPLLLVGSDDNDLDLYFIDEKINAKGHVSINYYYRFVVIVVMDAYNDYPLGFSYGERVSADLIKAAWLDAMHHIRQLTGMFYLPHQIQTDQWGRGTLDDFYSSIATYTPATARVARAKYIEQAFGTRWHQTLKLYPNYAGTNITSKSRLNPDALELNKKSFPVKEKGPAQIQDFINRMRHAVDPQSGQTKLQQWLEGFWASDKSQERQITDTKMLLTFGTPHKYTNKITNAGLRLTLYGEERVYEIPEPLYLKTVGKTVQAYYDPLDFSRVLITDGDKLRFVAFQYQLMPSALADYKQGDHNRLHDFFDQKKVHMQYIAEKKAQREEVLSNHRLDAESLLQAQVLVKEIKRSAEIGYQQRNEPETFDPYDKM